MDELTHLQQEQEPNVLDILHQAEDKFLNEIVEEDQMIQFMSAGGDGDGDGGGDGGENGNESLEKRVCKIRDLLANRVLKGWTILPTYCKGELCGYSPMVRLNEGDVPCCVVCGGTGTGLDGLYLKILREDVPAVIHMDDDDDVVVVVPDKEEKISADLPTEINELSRKEEQELHQEDKDITTNGYSVDDVVAAYGSNSLFVLSESSTMENDNETQEQNVLTVDTSVGKDVVPECITEDLYENKAIGGIVVSPTNTEPLYVLHDDCPNDNVEDTVINKDTNTQQEINKESYHETTIQPSKSNDYLLNVTKELEQIRQIAKAKVQEQMQYEVEQLEHMIKNHSSPWDEQVGDEMDDGCDKDVAIDEIEDNVELCDNVDVHDKVKEVTDGIVKDDMEVSEDIIESNENIKIEDEVEPQEINIQTPLEINKDMNESNACNKVDETPIDDSIEEYDPSTQNDIPSDLSDDLPPGISEVPSDEIVLENSVSMASTNHEGIVPVLSTSSNAVSEEVMEEEKSVEALDEVVAEKEMVKVTSEVDAVEMTCISGEEIVEEVDEAQTNQIPLEPSMEQVTQEDLIETTGITKEMAEEQAKSTDEDELEEQYQQYMNTINVLKNTTIYYQRSTDDCERVTPSGDTGDETEDVITECVDDVVLVSEDDCNDVVLENELSVVQDVPSKEELLVEENIPANVSEDIPLEDQENKEVVFEEEGSTIEEPTAQDETKEDTSSNVVTLQLPSDFNFDDENAVQFVLQQLRMSSSPSTKQNDSANETNQEVEDAPEDVVVIEEQITEEESLEITNDDVSVNSDEYEKYLPTSLQRQNNTNTTENDRQSQLNSIIYEPVLPFLADTLSCTIGEMLNDGWTLLDQPPCKGCNAPRMKYNDDNKTDIGQCVNVECPLNHDNSEGSTQVQSWDDNKDSIGNSYDEDDYSFEEDDPAIIQMQLNEMRKRGLIINNTGVQVGKDDGGSDHVENDVIEETNNVVTGECEVIEDVISHDDEVQNEEMPVDEHEIPSDEAENLVEDNLDDHNDEVKDVIEEEEVKMKSYVTMLDIDDEEEVENKGEVEDITEKVKKVKVKSYVTMFDDDDESEMENNAANNAITFAPPTPEARLLNRNRDTSTPKAEVPATITDEDSKLTDEDDNTKNKFSFDEEDIQGGQIEDDVDEESTQVEMFDNELIEETKTVPKPAPIPTPRVKRDGPPCPEDEDYEDDDLYYEPTPSHQYMHRNMNLMTTKRTSSANSNDIVKKDSFTNLIINTSMTDKQHPTDVSLLTSNSFQQESITSGLPNASTIAAASAYVPISYLKQAKLTSTKNLSSSSFPSKKKTKSTSNGPPRPDLYDIDESVVDDNTTDLHNLNNKGLPLVIESGYNNDDTNNNHYDNESLLSCEESCFNATSTIGSESLANILCKIEHVKDELSTPFGTSHNNDGDNMSFGSSKFKSEISNQMEMAQLIERLASAAIAVKQLEKSKKSSF